MGQGLDLRSDSNRQPEALGRRLVERRSGAEAGDYARIMRDSKRGFS
jgi:hypothetical protein